MEWAHLQTHDGTAENELLVDLEGQLVEAGWLLDTVCVAVEAGKEDTDVLVGVTCCIPDLVEEGLYGDRVEHWGEKVGFEELWIEVEVEGNLH